MELPRRERGDNMLPPGELTDIRRRLRLIAGKHDKVEEVWRLNKEFGHHRTFGWGIRLRFGRVKQLDRPPTSRAWQYIQAAYRGTPSHFSRVCLHRVFCAADVGVEKVVTSALSRLNIRIDGGPGGCGREGRRKVYGNIH